MTVEIRPIASADQLVAVATDIDAFVVFELQQVAFEPHEACGSLEADQIVRVMGFDVESGTTWRELESARVHDFITYNIGHDLAYSHSLRPRAECLELANRLLSLIRTPWSCFVRHSKVTPEQESYSCDPIRTDWTFSDVYLFVGSERATLCTFLAED